MYSMCVCVSVRGSSRGKPGNNETSVIPRKGIKMQPMTSPMEVGVCEPISYIHAWMIPNALSQWAIAFRLHSTR